MVEQSEQIRRFVQLFSHTEPSRELLKIFASQKFLSYLDNHKTNKKQAEKEFRERIEEQFSKGINEDMLGKIDKELLKKDLLKLYEGNIKPEPLKKIFQKHKGARSRLVRILESGKDENILDDKNLSSILNLGMELIIKNCFKNTY